MKRSKINVKEFHALDKNLSPLHFLPRRLFIVFYYLFGTFPTTFYSSKKQDIAEKDDSEDCKIEYKIMKPHWFCLSYGVHLLVMTLSMAVLPIGALL